MESIRNYFDDNPMAKGIAVTGCGLIASLIARRVLELASPRFGSVVGTLGFIASPIAGLAAASKRQEFPEDQEGPSAFQETGSDGNTVFLELPLPNGASVAKGSAKEEEERAPSADGALPRQAPRSLEAIE